MNNQYISKYSVHETHFSRTDKWPLASFDAENVVTPAQIILSALGVIAVFLALCFLGVL